MLFTVCGQTIQEIINGEDEGPKHLKREIGEDAYSAVIRAKNELNKYNIRDGFVVQKIRNFRDNRRTSAKECLSCLKSKRKRVEAGGAFHKYCLLDL